MTTQNADSVRLCGELLYVEGNAVAYCTMPWGTEHSHGDYTVAEMVERGEAARLAEGEHAAEILVMGGEVAQVNVLVYAAQNDRSGDAK